MGNRVIAHRGASAYAPENTLMAFHKAKELGAEWIECDVQLTSDGEAVIFHDSRLNRTTNGSGWLRWKKYADIQHLDAGSGEHIIKLEELLRCLEKLLLSVHLEIKPSFWRSKKTAEKVMYILHQHEPQRTRSIHISSFCWKTLHYVRRLDHSIPIALLMDRWNPQWKKTAEQLSCLSIHCSKDILTPQRILEIKNTGRKVLAYTVNHPHDAENLYQMGVDKIFSDYPNLHSLPITVKKSDAQ